MPIQVVNGATLMCPFGVAPSTLVVTPENRVLSGNQPAANIMDFVPMKNIMPFGMCTSLANPTVASATATALGVLTPMPCIPVTTPWKPGAATVLLGYMPALDNTCTCQCTWGGVITVTNPGQMTEMIP
ncbi:DUF4280 domain-containing protein [Thermomonas sp. HDW16]|uniref:DUF4280 domain-containing protein n=1 Tax=Thermomonas sp. HDW16 TaxID=2714945 RepID=UPI001409C444|nr:DUF4280 domain-containing protein [Thermomonas sp. HDW16]QIL20907.1 DUF4280 domain-containing protein [Thermomonas sp. HDW16]